MKRKGKPKNAEIDSSNIISPERTESIPWHLTDSENALTESPERKMVKRKVRRTTEGDEPSITKDIAVGDKVKILTTRFGSVYEKGKKKFTKGIVKSIIGKVYEVLWDGDSETMKSHITHLNKLVKEANPAKKMVAALLNKRIVAIELEAKLEDVRRQIEGWFKSATSLACILPILEVHAQLNGLTNDEPGNWPKTSYKL